MSNEPYPNAQFYPNYYPQATSQVYYPNYTQNQYPQQQNLQRQGPTQTGVNVQGMLPIQQSYIENILRLNKDKLVTVYMTFEGKNQQVFKGTIEAAGRDHIIIKDPETQKRYLLLMIYLDYVVFDEVINYKYPFDTTSQNFLSSYPPR